MKIRIPSKLIGWHGHGETKIIYQNGENIVLDLSNWIDKRGYGEWKDGIKIKKEFPSHILIFTNLMWNKENVCNECDDITISRGIIKGNRFYGRLFDKAIFLMEAVTITFVHKSRQVKEGNHICIEPENYEDEELQKIIELVKCN